MDSLKFHPICLLFPPMSDAEFDALVEDVRANGLLDDIVLFEGMVLEGRHRIGACKLAGVEPRFTEFQGDRRAALSFAASKNLHRRSLTESQRAAIAAELAAQLEAEDAVKATATAEKSEETTSAHWCAEVPEAPKPAHRPKTSRTAEAAKETGASVRSTQKARRVMEASPELHEKVKAGEVTVQEAERKVAETSAPRGAEVPKTTAPPPTPVDLIGAKVGSILETLGPLDREIRELCDLDPSRDRAKLIEALGKLIAAVKGQKRRMTPKPVDDTDRYVEQLWQLYPRKEGKGQAVKAIEKALKTTSFFYLKPAVEEYAEAVETWATEDRQYVPHAATWFNQRRWEDDRTLWRAKGAAASKTAGLEQFAASGGRRREVSHGVELIGGSDEPLPF